jgi:hypothetical protein
MKVFVEPSTGNSCAKTNISLERTKAIILAIFMGIAMLFGYTSI